MFAFVNQSSSSAWGDESDEELATPAVIPTEQAEEEEEEDDEEEDSDEESEEEGEEESDASKPVAETLVKITEPAKTLSKKEKKQLEDEAFEKALADLGINSKCYRNLQK